jgi:hypothetical protein
MVIGCYKVAIESPIRSPIEASHKAYKKAKPPVQVTRDTPDMRKPSSKPATPQIIVTKSEDSSNKKKPVSHETDQEEKYEENSEDPYEADVSALLSQILDITDQHTGGAVGFLKNHSGYKGKSWTRFYWIGIVFVLTFL